MKLPPISHHGNVNEIVGKFGGADQLRNAGVEFEEFEDFAGANACDATRAKVSYTHALC